MVRVYVWSIKISGFFGHSDPQNNIPLEANFITVESTTPNIQDLRKEALCIEATQLHHCTATSSINGASIMLKQQTSNQRFKFAVFDPAASCGAVL